MKVRLNILFIEEQRKELWNNMFKRGEIYRNKTNGEYIIITDSKVDRPKCWFYTVLGKSIFSNVKRIKTESGDYYYETNCCGVLHKEDFVKYTRVDKGYLKLNKEKNYFEIVKEGN